MVNRLRRRILLSSIPVGVSLYVGSWWAFKVRRDDSSDIVTSIIRKRLSYLDISDQDIIKYSSDLQRSLSPGIRTLASWAGIVEPIYSRIEIFHINAYAKKYFDEFEEFVVSRFLLSSDFFFYNAKEDRKIKYLGLYPYAIPCSNPFAQVNKQGPQYQVE